jgi:predicted flap endonuclease-1-like 5' DNA nuclease
MGGSDRQGADDLTVIDGIGPARSDWLRDALGVRTYRDLAARSPDEIVAALRAAGRVAVPRDVAGWIARARELSAAPEATEWTPLASFVVEFQGLGGHGPLRTLGHHVEADENESWPGVETEQVARWMRARAPVTDAAPAAAEPAEAPPEAEAEAAAPVADQAAPAQEPIGPVLVAFAPGRAEPWDEPARTGMLGRTATGWLAAGEAFTVGVRPETPRAKERAWHVSLDATDLATGMRTHLGDAAAGEPDGSPSAGATLRGCSLPEGVYRLDVLLQPGRGTAPMRVDTSLLRVG